jgi:hypothetical protein
MKDNMDGNKAATTTDHSSSEQFEPLHRRQRNKNQAIHGSADRTYDANKDGYKATEDNSNVYRLTDFAWTIPRYISRPAGLLDCVSNKSTQTQITSAIGLKLHTLMIWTQQRPKRTKV